MFILLILLSVILFSVDIQKLRPTMLVGVPRVWERIEDNFFTKLGDKNKIKYKIVRKIMTMITDYYKKKGALPFYR